MTITQSEMRELEGVCTQRGCEDTPVRVVYWPGKVPPPRYCLPHALKAVAVLAAMGVRVAVEEITT